MPDEIKKQMSVCLWMSEWRRLRTEAARLNIPITRLVKRELKPLMDRLEREEKEAA